MVADTYRTWRAADTYKNSSSTWTLATKASVEDNLVELTTHGVAAALDYISPLFQRSAYVADSSRYTPLTRMMV